MNYFLFNIEHSTVDDRGREFNSRVSIRLVKATCLPEAEKLLRKKFRHDTIHWIENLTLDTSEQASRFNDLSTQEKWDTYCDICGDYKFECVCGNQG